MAEQSRTQAARNRGTAPRDVASSPSSAAGPRSEDEDWVDFDAALFVRHMLDDEDWPGSYGAARLGVP